MPRPRSPEGHRIHVNVMLNEQEAAAIDAARGNLERGPWIRQAAFEEARRRQSSRIPQVEQVGDPANIAAQSNLVKNCKHKGLTLTKGVCPDCFIYVESKSASQGGR